ncbi:MAG TPA: hypothetical protein VFO29_08510 [Candidatus Rubrimentiphilum sp.]|nr:hypothetical protein [Candidatus Rubrimentiphilum sp.]
MRLSTALCLLSIVALAACGSQKTTTYSTSNGTATVTDNGKTKTLETKEGKITAGQGAVDLSKLGAPLYPGASQTEDNSSVSVTTASGSSYMASFTTNDSFDKVYSWYQGKMPKGSEKMHVSQEGASIAEFLTDENTANQTLVMVTSKDNQTQIVITHGK